jgi:hypothetical protein
MNSKELLEAATVCLTQGYDISSVVKRGNAADLLANYIRDTVKEDDDELLTVDRLRSAGYKPSIHHNGSDFIVGKYELCKNHNHESFTLCINGLGLVEVKTIGQFRNLCAALEIELPEAMQ